MEIKLIGTGKMGQKRFSACALIDEEILFDCPNGVVQRIQGVDFDITKIKVVIISHFHGDHDFDVPFLLYNYVYWFKRIEPLIIIAPAGAEARYKKLCEIANFDNTVERANVQFIEVSGEPVNTNGYQIIAYRMNHGELDAYGYRISKKGKTIAFTGDTAMCENIQSLLKDTQMAFIDVTGPGSAWGKTLHLDIPDFENLKSQYKNCRMIPVHMRDKTREELKLREHETPEDFDVFVI